MTVFPLAMIKDYADKYPVPEFVKSAAVISEDDIKKLASTSFADMRREYPIHSKAATWLSHLKFNRNKDNSTRDNEIVKTRLKIASSFWGIQNECIEVSDKVNEVQQIKEASAEHYALALDDVGPRREKLRIWPLTDDHIKSSAIDFVENRHNYPFEYRKTAAERILAKLSYTTELGDVFHTLEKSACLGAGNRNNIKRHIRNRILFCKESNEAKDLYKELYNKIDKINLDSDNLKKVAQFLEMNDRVSGLARLYNKTIDLPEDFCFSNTPGMQKLAADKKIKLTNGAEIDKGTLSKTSAQKFAAMGDDFVEKLANEDGKIDVFKAEEILPTLPRDDADAVLACMAIE